jgi:hypothetical protein
MSWMQRFLFLNKQMDGVTVIVGGYPVYRAKLDALMKQGMTREEAQELAVEAWAMATDPVQQPVLKVSQPTWYRNPSALGMAYRQFIIAPLKYTITGVMGLATGIQTLYVGWKKGTLKTPQVRRLLKQQFGDFVLYYWVLPLVFNAMGAGIATALQGGDEEAWESFWKNMRRSLLFGGLAGYPIAGQAAAAGGSRLINFFMNEDSMAVYGKEGALGFLKEMLPAVVSVPADAFLELFSETGQYAAQNPGDFEAWIAAAQTLGDTSFIGPAIDRVDAIWDYLEGDSTLGQAITRAITGRSAYQTGVVDR